MRAASSRHRQWRGPRRYCLPRTRLQRRARALQRGSCQRMRVLPIGYEPGSRLCLGLQDDLPPTRKDGDRKPERLPHFGYRSDHSARLVSIGVQSNCGVEEKLASFVDCCRLYGRVHFPSGKRGDPTLTLRRGHVRPSSRDRPSGHTAPRSPCRTPARPASAFCLPQSPPRRCGLR